MSGSCEAKVDHFTAVHVVLGNEACDLDSAVSALSMALQLHKLNEVHEDSAPSYKAIYCYMNEFKLGRKSKQDEPCPGWSVNIREIAETISLDRVHHILHVKLQMKKLCAR
ncbi:PRUNE [Cordylochernes scorpioides]|uniref:PRUNE n=1 Tax=Cordylochernes scorpioides TaxID=51811 RepID=A0ABY6K5I4_9ARAC|nr:PRUNE [Cordylochernes scorpioides]